MTGRVNRWGWERGGPGLRAHRGGAQHGAAGGGALGGQGGDAIGDHGGDGGADGGGLAELLGQRACRWACETAGISTGS